VIELAPLSGPDLVPATVATALRLALADDVVSPERVANALAAKQLPHSDDSTRLTCISL
jgi:hypothetical protein